MKTMYIIDMIVKSKERALTYMPMHLGYDVDDKEIENRVYIISKKFPEKKVYIETKDFCDRHGEKYRDKAICVETKK